MGKVRSQFLFRVIYAFCAVFVTAYVFFDILDIDGSNRPFNPYAPKGAIVLVGTVAEAETSLLPDLPIQRGSISNDLATYPVVLASFRHNEGLRIAGLSLSRRHRYRVALPRSSVPDPFVV